MAAVRDENQNFPAGNVQRGNDDRIVEVTGRVAEPGHFADLIVARRGAAPVYLRQVATVVDGQQELENIAMLNGSRARSPSTWSRPRAPTPSRWRRACAPAVAELQKSLPSTSGSTSCATARAASRTR